MKKNSAKVCSLVWFYNVSYKVSEMICCTKIISDIHTLEQRPRMGLTGRKSNNVCASNEGSDIHWESLMVMISGVLQLYLSGSISTQNER